MKRLHIAIATHNVEASIEDYSARFEARPCACIPGEYALWRTATVNRSIRKDLQCSPGTLRHLGFEDPHARAFTMSLDVNGIDWENFSQEQQAAEIEATWPGTDHGPV